MSYTVILTMSNGETRPTNQYFSNPQTAIMVAKIIENHVAGVVSATPIPVVVPGTIV